MQQIRLANSATSFATPFTTIANEKFYLQLMQPHLQQLQTDAANEVAEVVSRIFVNNL